METAAANAIRDLAIAQLKRSAGHLIQTFEVTPEEKLDLKLTETAKSPREMVEHVLDGNGYIAQSLGFSLSPGNAATDRAALVARLSTTVDEIADRIAKTSDAEMDSTVEFFGRQMPRQFLFMAASWHISRHAAQIDFIQTTWGDLEDHMP